MFNNVRNPQFSGGEYTNVGRDLQTTNHYYAPPPHAMFSNPAVLKEKGKSWVDFKYIDNKQMTVYLAMEKLLEHIAPGAFHNSGERYDPPKCHPNTRNAILRKIITWAQDPHNLQLIMWIYGPAGAGKSAIMQTIAEQFEQAGLLGGSFFFFRTGEKRNIKTHFIATLAYQLAVKYPTFYEYITMSINDDPSIFSQTLDAQLKALILNPMLAIINAYPDVRNTRYIILVDGLDECFPEDSHREIITILSKSAFSPFRFIIASRPEYAIRNTFSLQFVVENTETLPLDDKYQSYKDIELFLRDKFKELKSNHPQGPYFPASWPTEASITALVHNSSGQFVYAATVIKFLESPRHNPVKALYFVLKAQPSPERSETPFAQLDALYHYVLDTVQDIAKVLAILHCIMLVHGTSSIDNVEAFLGYSNGESRTVLCDMHSLLHIPKNNHDEIRFYHTSLGDFLRDQQRSRHLYVPPRISNSFVSACYAQLYGCPLLVPGMYGCPLALLLSADR